MAEQGQASHQDLERRVSEMTRDLATLYAITSPISGANELKSVLADALAMIMQVTGADAGTIRLIDPQTDRFVVSSSVGLSEIYVREAPLATGDDEMLAEVLRRGQPAIAGDLVQDPRTRHSPLLWDGLKSAVYLPLKTPKSNLGAVVLASREPGGFSPSQRELFGVVSRQISTTIENARLFEEAERQRVEAEEFARIVGMLTESLDVTVVGQRVAESVLKFLSVDSAVLWLLQPDGSMIAAASAGAARERYVPGKSVMPPGTGMPGRAVREGAPVWSGDVLSDHVPYSEEILNIFATQGSVAALAVPFRMQGKIIGALVASDKVGREFSEREVSLLQTFASQAGLAFEQARLHEETDRRRREAEALARVAQSLTESLDMTAVGERIVTSVRELFGVKAAMLRLRQPDGSLRTLASSGDSFSQRSGGNTLPAGAGLTGRAVMEGRPIWSPDVLNEPKMAIADKMRDHQVQSGNHSMIAVPLRAHEKIIGSLGLQDRTGRAYAESDVALLQTFADQAALALENARLFEETRRRNLELQALYTVTNTTTQSLDIKSLTQAALVTTIEVLGVDAGRLYVLDEEHHVLRLAAHHGLPVDGLSDYECYTPEEGVVGRIFSQNRPVVFADLSSDPNYAAMARTGKGKAWGFRSAAGLPITAKGRPVGVIYVNGRAVREFTPQDLKFLSVIGEQIGGALENARLYEVAERRRREAEELGLVSRTLTESLDVSAVGQRIVESVLPLFAGQDAVVWLVQPDSSMTVLASTSRAGDILARGYVFAPGVGVPARVIADGRPVWFSDVLSQEDIVLPDDLRRRIADSGTAAVLGVPLRAKSKIIGALIIRGRTGRAFSRDEVALLETFAAQGALTLENARLYEEAERRRGEAEVLAQVARSLTESLEVEAVATRIVEGVRRLLHVGDATVYQLQDEHSLLALAVSGGSGLRKAGYTLSVGTGAAGQAVVKGEPIFSSDILHDPKIVLAELNQQLEPLGDRSVLAIPLRSKDQIIGALSVSGRVGRVFRDAEISLLQTFGDQAALTLEKARLYQETERRRRETEELAQVARSLTESLELEAVATRIVEGVRRLLKVPESTVFRLQTDGSLVAVALSGVLKDDGRNVGYVLSPGAGVSGLAVARDEPVHSPDIMQDAEITKTDIHRHLTTTGIRSVVSTPIRSKGQVIGALAAGDQIGRVFTENDVALLQTFGDQAALALENARLYEAERTRQEQLSAVRKVGQEVSTELELEPLLHLVVRRAVELAGVSSGIVYTLEDQVLVPRAWWNLGPWLSEVQFRLGEGIPGIVAQSGQAMIVNDYLHSPYVHALFRDRSTVTALIAMPLISKGKVVGVITINNSETNRRFTEADQAMLSLFAPQAASAIETARLFEETERRRREAEELAQVARSLTESLEVGAVATRIVEGVRRLLGVAEATVFQLQDDGSLLAIAKSAREGVNPKVGYVLPRGAGNVGRAVATGEPECCPDILHDTDLTENEVLRDLAAAGIRALLSVPLRSKGQIIGALGVGDGLGRVYTERDTALLQTLGDQAALALENARLFGELGATTKELAGRNKELDTFVYTVSHDLKAPLVTLQGMADLLAESCRKDLDEQGQHYVTRIKANAQQMERLVLDLLTLSRIGREGRAPEAVVLDELVDELLLEWGERIRTRGVTVTRHKLPTLWGVRTQIEQVIGNLVGNAIKYMGDTPAPVVEIGANDNGGHMAECYVKDNGIGIDPAYHEKVFEIFQRLQETEAEGTGVGLAIVKKVVEGAGGQIWLESARGQGATFRFTWPRAEVAA